jgi:hypothetical protein
MWGSFILITTFGNPTNPTITLTSNDIQFNAPIKGTIVVGDMDVKETLDLFMFFIQSRHPEVINEFNAIKKIKES